MKLRFRLLNHPRLGLLAFTIHALVAASAAAQQPEPAPLPTAEPAPQAETTVAAPAAPEPVGPLAQAPEVTNTPALDPQAAAPAAPPPPEAPPQPEPPPPPAVDALGPLNLAVWTRVDVTLSNGDELSDQSSTGEFELRASGKVYENISVILNLVATYGGNDGIASSANVLDGVIRIEPSEFFNVWLGRMLVPVDRSNFSGPYFMAPWLYPGFGFADGQVIAPREGPFGRNDGVTIWGQVGGGLFKYYAGMFDLHNQGQSPLFSGRLSLSLLNPEPGFFGSSTFYGKDLLGIGVGLQSKKDGSVLAGMGGAPDLVDDYSEFNVDVLFEKNFGDAGVLDIEGAFHKFNGDYEVTDVGWFALASYVLPGDVVGGKLQPLVRIQQALPTDDDASTSTLIDAQLGFILNAYATRFALGYRSGSAGDAEVQALYFGAQVQK